MGLCEAPAQDVDQSGSADWSSRSTGASHHVERLLERIESEPSCVGSTTVARYKGSPYILGTVNNDIILIVQKPRV